MRVTLWVVSLGLCAAVAFSGGAVFATTEESKYDALKRFSQVLDIVERYYVRDVPRKDLMNGAVKGMLQGLDPPLHLPLPGRIQGDAGDHLW